MERVQSPKNVSIWALIYLISDSATTVDFRETVFEKYLDFGLFLHFFIVVLEPQYKFSEVLAIVFDRLVCEIFLSSGIIQLAFPRDHYFFKSLSRS